MNEISEPYEGFFIKWRTKGPNKNGGPFAANVRYEGFSDPPFGKKMSDDVITGREVAGREFEL